jgi:predicted nucleotidyltransferase
MVTMRLPDTEKDAIVRAVQAVDPEAKVYLFGSRTDDTKRGGDIDVLILSRTITLEDKLDIKASIFETIEEQKIDLIVAADASQPFVQMVLENGQELT